MGFEGEKYLEVSRVISRVLTWIVNGEHFIQVLGFEGMIPYTIIESWILVSHHSLAFLLSWPIKTLPFGLSKFPSSSTNQHLNPIYQPQQNTASTKIPTPKIYTQNTNISSKELIHNEGDGFELIEHEDATEELANLSTAAEAPSSEDGEPKYQPSKSFPRGLDITTASEKDCDLYFAELEEAEENEEFAKTTKAEEAVYDTGHQSSVQPEEEVQAKEVT